MILSIVKLNVWFFLVAAGWRAEAQPSCSIFENEDIVKSCNFSLSPPDGPEVGGTVVRIQNLAHDDCPIIYNSGNEEDVYCRFMESEAFTQIGRGRSVNQATVECVSPFSGQEIGVNVSFAVLPRNCPFDQNSVQWFTADEEFQYSGDSAGAILSTTFEDGEYEEAIPIQDEEESSKFNNRALQKQSQLQSFPNIIPFERNGFDLYYMLNSQTKNWFAHEAVANSCGGTLASVTSESESALIAQYTVLAWIGAHQPPDCTEPEPSGCWEFIDGSEWFSNWETGEPNDIYDEECIEKYVSGKWNDQECTDILQGIYIFSFELSSFGCSLCNENELFLNGECFTTSSPTSSPSSKPPSSPTISPSSAPTTSEPTTTPPTLSPTTTAPTITCADDPDFRYQNKDKKSCRWISSVTIRRNTLCRKSIVHNACPVACGLCCKDDASFTFKTDANVDQNCAWLGKESSRIQMYCDRVTIKIGCIETCGNCLDYISVAPSDAPTASPTIACANDPGFRYQDKEWKSCLWISNASVRRVTLCPKAVVHNACPATCGVCCRDDASFTFRTNSNQEEDCAWLAESSIRQDTYCNNASIKIGCVQTCNNCQEYLSVAPSAAPVPTLTPTKSPSAVPTVVPSFYPTNFPTESPSTEPSSLPSNSPSNTPSYTPSDQASFSPSATPTTSPSNTPSENPNSSPSLSPTYNPTTTNEPSLSNSPTTSPSISATPSIKCDNDKEYKYNVEDASTSCTWIGINDIRRQTLCAQSEVHNACPITCGVCCGDDTDFKFTTFAGQKEDCAWIAMRSVRQDKYCNEKDIKINCAETCGFCQEYLSVAPSVTPSIPIVAPSNLIIAGTPTLVEWRSFSVTDDSANDDSNLVVKLELLAYNNKAHETNTNSFQVIQTFSISSIYTNNAILVVDDDTISDFLISKWGIEGTVAIILVRIAMYEKQDNNDWIRDTRSSKLIGVLPESTSFQNSKEQDWMCPIVPTDEACPNDIDPHPCPPSKRVAGNDIRFDSDRMCSWPSGKNTCEPDIDLTVNIERSELIDDCSCDTFHPGAAGCFRFEQSQCCYSATGSLINKIDDGAGTAKCYSTDKSLLDTIGNFLIDVLPYSYCCLLNDDCESYYESRSTVPKEGYVNPQPAARAFGDPHLTTFDDLSYDFNGYGEYIAYCTYIDDPFLPLQELLEKCDPARTKRKSGRGILSVNYRFATFKPDQQGTVTVGVAMEDPLFRNGEHSLVVQVNPNPNIRLDLFNGDSLVRFPSERKGRVKMKISGATIIKTANTERKVMVMTIRLPSGATIRISETDGVLLPAVTKRGGNSIGLLGFPDDMKVNDFTNSSGSVLEFPLQNLRRRLEEKGVGGGE